jgi:hypothetical protein
MEARIYKTKRLRNGKRVTARLYRARVKLTGDNKVRDISLGVSDKQVAQQKLNKLIQELEAMMVGGESACRPNKGEDGGFEWGRKFCPSRDYLGQVRTGQD